MALDSTALVGSAREAHNNQMPGYGTLILVINCYCLILKNFPLSTVATGRNIGGDGAERVARQGEAKGFQDYHYT